MYNDIETNTLTEEYEALRSALERRGPKPGLWILVRLCDLDAALAHLPRKERVAILLLHTIGMSLGETAELLGVSRTTVWRYQNSGLKRLNDIMNGRC